MSTIADYQNKFLSTRFWSYTQPGRIVFTVSGVTVTPTAGAVYRDSSARDFTVVSAAIVAGDGAVYCTGTNDAAGAPDTLTKQSGTGDASLSYSASAQATKIVVSLPAGTAKVVMNATAPTNCSFTTSNASLVNITAMSTWPQPVFCDPRSGGDCFLYEPSPSATPKLVVAMSAAVTIEAVIYVNTRIAPDDLTTALTQTYTYV